MFTGLVEIKGIVEDISPIGDIFRMDISCPKDWVLELGESIAINGACMTVAAIKENIAQFEVSRESLRLTNLGKLTRGTSVNLERALRLGDRLGGHMVSGHVDGMGELKVREPAEDGWHLQVKVPESLCRYIIAKGSICLDGVSLTVNALDDFSDHSIIHLMLIPTTLAVTTLAEIPIGWPLNIEVDLVGKYVERLGYRR